MYIYIYREREREVLGGPSAMGRGGFQKRDASPVYTWIVSHTLSLSLSLPPSLPRSLALYISIDVHIYTLVCMQL